MNVRPELPRAVRLCEVGPRDGLQNEKAMVPTDVKVALIDMLTDAGLPAIEATSFVSPKWVPQMADAADVMARIARKPGVRYPVLTPNLKGFDAALAAGADEVAVFVAATESFSQTQHQLLDRRKPRALRGRCSRRRAKPACAFAATSRSCSAARTKAMSIRRPSPTIAAALHAMGAYEVSLGDTIGTGTPGKTQALLRRVARARADRPHWPVISTTRTARRSRTSTRRSKSASRRSTARWPDSAAARTRRARPAMSRPRTSSICSTDSVSRPAWT